MTAQNLIDGQYRFDSAAGYSLVMGRDTPIRVLNVTGLRALGPISSADVKRTGQHGALRSGPRTYGQRVIQFDLAVEGQDYKDVEVLLDELFAAFQVTDDPGTFTLKRRAKEERQAAAAVTRSEFVSDYDSWLGWAKGSVEIAADDPLFYASTVDVETMTPPFANMSGRTYDRVYPMVYGAPGSSAPIVTVENRGTAGSSPTLVINGPIENPGIRLMDTGEAVKFNITLGDNDQLFVDFDLHVVLLNGGSRRNCVDPSSAWWDAPPGKSRVFLLGQATGMGASAVINIRSAWPSA